MNIKELKKEARKNLKRNFLRTILVTFIAGIIINGGYNYSTYIYDNTNIMNKGYTYIKTNYEALKNVISNFTNDGYEARGVIAPLVNNITENRSITVGFINTVNNLIFGNNLSNQTTIILVFMASVFIYVFIQNVFKVGKNRYFLEQRRYKNTKIEKILFPYQISRAWHIAYVSFYKSLYQVLWIPTIVGGIIKHYEYKMIPYILAENPNVSKEEAFKLSKELSNGYKLEMVKLDLSLIGWYVLQIMTFGISSVFYFNSYKECIYSELYMSLRKNKYNEYKNIFNDQYLDIDEFENKSYPMDKYSIKVNKKYNIDYMRKYKITTYILLFFTFSFAGWIWEVLLGIFETGVFVNRGALHGPWLPIYGTGCVITLIALKPLRKHPVLFFIGAMLLCGTIEYGTAWFLETFKNLRWWSYDGYFLNLQGRICLEGLLVFGLASTANTYFLAPFMDNIYSKIPHKLSIILCIILVTIYGIDFIYSQDHPNTGYGVSGELQVIDD